MRSLSGPHCERSESSPRQENAILRLLVILLAITLPIPLLADDTNDDKNWDFNINFEDDYPGISFWGNDRLYTAGWRFSYVWGEEDPADWIQNVFAPLIDEDTQVSRGFALMQQIYTPTDLSIPTLIADDEPYAGYLFVGLSLGLRNESTLHSFALQLGVIGPPSLAGPVQINFHKWFNFEPVLGWANQLGTEPAVTLFYQQKRMLWSVELPAGERIFDFDVMGEAALGNVHIFAGLGVQFRAGFSLSDDFGPTVLTPMGTDPFVSPEKSARGFFEACVFGAVEARGIARNLFLDGSTFASSPHVDKEWLVLDYDFGIEIRVAEIRFSWRQIARSQEFTTEDPTNHPFASLNLAYSYRF